MSGVYVTGELADQIIRAQQVIYKHLTGCALCASARPCYERDRAEALFVHYGLLPRRTPGLTRRPPSSGWDV